MKTNILIATMLLLLIHTVQSQDKIDIHSGLLQTSRIQESTDKFLVYLEHPEKGTFGISIWERAVSTKKVNGKERIIIKQHWHSDNKSQVRKIITIVDPLTFKTIYHRADMDNKIEAFDFEKGKIIGSDSVKNNERINWELVTQVSPFNWELDIEMLQMLPYENGKDFNILYYHPGSPNTPKYELYSLVGIESIPVSNESTMIECYKLVIDYGQGNSATFWVSMDTKKLVKMEELYGQLKRYKIRI